MSLKKNDSKVPVFEKVLEAKRVERAKEKYFPSLARSLETGRSHKNNLGPGKEKQQLNTGC